LKRWPLQPKLQSVVVEFAMITLSVPEMSCASCKASVEQALARVPGHERASVDLAARRVVVDGTADSVALIAALNRAGFAASSLN
jgi:copper chaperone CopZ